MRRVVLLSLLMSTALACGGGPDICHQLYTQDVGFYSLDNACVPVLADSGTYLDVIDGGNDPASALRSCEQTVQYCTGTEQSAILNYLSCITQAPVPTCTFVVDQIACGEDPSCTNGDPTYSDWLTVVGNCKDTFDNVGVSTTCLDVVSLFSTPGLSYTTTPPPNWAGTYTVAAGGSFTDGTNTTAPSGTETLTESSYLVTWANFGAPSLSGCMLSNLTALTSSISVSSLSCGGFNIQDATMTLSGTTISVFAEGTDSMGAAFQLSYSLSQ